MKVKESPRKGPDLLSSPDMAQEYLAIAGVIILVLDKRGKIVLVNRKGAEVLGREPGELIGKSWFTTCLPKRVKKRVRGIFLDIMEGRLDLHEKEEDLVVCKNGEERLIAWHNTILTDSLGNIIGSLSSGEDITEQRRMDNELRTTEERYRSFVHNFHGIAFQSTLDFVPIFIHGAVEGITGYTEQEFTRGNPRWDQLIHPDDRWDVPSNLRKARLTPDLFSEREYRILPKGGGIKWVKEYVQFILGDRGEPTIVQGVVYDVTERRKMEEALHESEEKYRLLVENADEFVVVAQDGMPKFVNRKAAEISGYSREELLSRPFIEIIHPEDRQRVIDRFQKRMKGESVPYPFQFRAVDKGGNVKWVEAKAALINWEGRPATLNLVTDITDRKLAEERVEHLNRVLKSIRNINQIIVVEKDKTVLIQKACAILTEVSGYRMVWIGLIEGGHKRVIPAAHAGFESGYLKKAAITWDDGPTGRGPTGRAIKTRRPCAFNDVADNPDYLPWRDEALKRGYRSSLAAPLIHEDTIYGALTVYSDRMAFFDEEETKLLEELARDLAFALSAIDRDGERRRAEEELRINEEKYHTLVENLHDVIFKVDTEGTILYVSPVVERLFGYRTEEVVGRALSDFVYPEDLIETSEAFYRGLTEDITSYELRLTDRQGAIHYVRGSARSFYEGGKPAGYTGVLVDITERKALEESLWLTQFSVDMATDAVMWMGPDASYFYVNEAACRLLGYAREELLKMTAHDLNPAHPKELWPAHWDELAWKKSLTFEAALRAKDGRMVPVEIAANYLEYGETAYNCAFVRDITDRKKAEEALRESEQRYRELVENIEDIVYVMDDKGRFRYLNKAMESLFGYSKDEIMTMSYIDFIEPSSRDRVQEIFKGQLAGEDVGTFELDFHDKDGRVKTIEARQNLVWDGGRVIEVHGLGRDITERKKVEGALRESEERYRTLVDNLPIGIYRNTPGEKGRFLFANSALMKMFGIGSPEELRAIPPADLYQNPSERKVFSDNLLKKGSVSGVELKLKKIDGTPIWGSVTARVVYDDGGDPASFDCTLEDITDRKRAEETLRESEERYRALFENATIGIFHSLPEGRLLRANPALAAMTGYDSPGEMISAIEDIGAQLYVDPKRRSDILAEVIRAGGWSRYENQYRRKDGGVMTANLAVRPVYRPDGTVDYLEGFVEDITDKKKMEQQLLQAEKLSSLGGILSGVAHELNNPLTSIIGNAQLLMRKEMAEDIREKLEIIQEESLRSSKIIQGLLAFARKHKPERKPIKINDVIQEAYRLREYDLRVNDVNMKLELADSIPVTHADPYQLQQVFINLINNAHDALIGVGGGSLIIRSVSRDDTIAIEFVDDGPGIPESIKKYIFDPFFTTKEVGKGTGLGLSVAYGIVSEHGGRIIVESEAGRGAKFIIELPVVRGTDEEKRPIEERARKPEGTRSILVVEDEENLRNLISMVLSEEGYHVDLCPDGERAIELINNKEYDAILTDMKMPGISGKDLYTFVQKHYPDQANRILFITGDVLGKDTQHFLRITGNRFIEKPFVIEKLLAVLSEIISG